MKNWKTTSSGIALILTGITAIVFAAKKGTLDQTVISASATSILSGIGLILAKDSNVTGGTVQQ